MSRPSEFADAAVIRQLSRIADALERLSPPPPPWPRFGAQEPRAYVWQPDPPSLRAVPTVPALPLALLRGVEPQKALLLANTRRFADGLPANNALLWGARGTGKSSLVKAIHAELSTRLVLVEVHREDIATLGPLLTGLRTRPDVPVLLFCDDLSFESEDADYKALKSLLEGGIEGRPGHVLFYATSNRRHLMPRASVENESRDAIHRHEAVDEKVSLSDRFGLWVGFHTINQATYLDMVHAYAAHYRLDVPADEVERRAREWQVTRGARSGRVAWQFIQDLAGELGVRLR